MEENLLILIYIYITHMFLTVSADIISETSSTILLISPCFEHGFSFNITLWPTVITKKTVDAIRANPVLKD
jgi:hypothetical protein